MGDKKRLEEMAAEANRLIASAKAAPAQTGTGDKRPANMRLPEMLTAVDMFTAGPKPPAKAKPARAVPEEIAPEITEEITEEIVAPEPEADLLPSNQAPDTDQTLVAQAGQKPAKRGLFGFLRKKNKQKKDADETTIAHVTPEVTHDAPMPDIPEEVIAAMAVHKSDALHEAEELALAPEAITAPDLVDDEIFPAANEQAEFEAEILAHDPPADTAPMIEPQSADMLVAPAPPLMDRLAPAVVWLSILCVIGSISYAVFAGSAMGIPLLILGGGIFLFLALLVAASMTNSFSPAMLAGVLFHRVRGKKIDQALHLAGADILAPLGIAEDILNVDIDARLVTTKEGVVVYANEAYTEIANHAGISGSAGLPPRIDRLFAQAGPESRKIFHLCRSARGAISAEEVITQMMGAGGNARLRRFEIALRPMKTQPRGPSDYIAWRLREQEVEDEQNTLIEAYKEYPRPVLGVERSGRIVWINTAMAEVIGTLPRGGMELSDFVLGDTSDLLTKLWEEDASPTEARMRKRSGGALTTELTPFLRSGVGEGFVCVELQPELEGATNDDAALLSADMSDAPFGLAVVEGDIGSDAKLVDANKMFKETFALSGTTPSLNDSLDADVVRQLTNEIKSRSSSGNLTRPVEVKLGEGANASIMHLFARPVKRRRGSYGERRTILYAVDVSFQKRMEEDYSQDQKLKTIGHLAGQIAHDFNNLLLVIMGSAEFLMRRHSAGDPSYPDLVLIQQNARRAKNLTANLLAFSRKQTLQSEVLSITEMLREFSVFLNRSITERVELKLINGRNLTQVKADKGQLELAIMNLAVNARDAMPHGGTLTIETKQVLAQDIAAYHYPVLDETDHVLIEVADTGEGVPADIADKIFEPFFTTKGEGKGTGLGLSTVYGVIGQMGGRIFLHNGAEEGGEGATFRIFLPAYEMAEGEQEAAAQRATDIARNEATETTDLTGKGRILVVEDEDGVRGIIVRSLQMCGYEITEANDGDIGLELLEEADHPFDLILTDIMMPEMDGPTMIAEGKSYLKQAKVIFMSGYAEGSMRDKLDTMPEAGYLQKPFSLKVVAAKVKDALSV